MRRFSFRIAALTLTACVALAAPTAVKAAEAGVELPKYDWSFTGPFGTFDRGQLQRGFQVYKNVCAACHSLNRVAYRNLAALGYNEAEIKTIAAEAMILDSHPNDEGELVERPGRPSDRFKAPFANEQAARFANGGAYPLDLSLITRARAGGADYVSAILLGYGTPPADVKLNPGMHYNKYFSGHQIAMPAPLVSDDQVPYADGTKATVEQMSHDVSAFLAWAGDPTQEKRKQVGLKVMLFLIVFSGMMYAVKRSVWSKLH